MPTETFAVPLVGDSPPKNLGLFGFAKTFVCDGSPAFDAFVMVNNGDGPMAVARLQGNTSQVVKLWGSIFFIRRLDDGNNNGAVNVSVQSSESLPAPTLSSYYVNGAVGTIGNAPLGAVDEPITLLLVGQPGQEVDVLVSGVSGSGVVASIGRLTANTYMNIDNLSDFSSLQFKVLANNDETVSVILKTLGKAQADANNLVVMGALDCTTAGPAVAYQSTKGLSEFNGVATRTGVGTFQFGIDPDVGSANLVLFSQIDPSVGDVPGRLTLRAQASIDAGLGAVNVTITNSAGAVTDPVGSVRVFVAAYA